MSCALPGGSFRLIDLSVALGPGPSEILPVAIEAWDHRRGGEHLAELLGVGVEAIPGARAWASERLTAVTHVGTHMDAPYHCAPQIGGQSARTIDEVPLEWFWGPAVCLRPAPAAEAGGEEPVGLDELLRLEPALAGDLPAGTLVLVSTGAERHHGEPAYHRAGRPLAPQVIEHLGGLGVRVLGTDAWSIDPSIPAMREAVRRRGGAAAWESHRAAARRELCILERLSNLAGLPPRGFWLACFPIKIHRGSAGWVRPVAFVPRGEHAATT
jgi:kynurenine formamidase